MMLAANTPLVSVAYAKAPIKVEAITVRTGRIICDVLIEDPDLRFTTPELAQFVCETYPELPHHACVNSKGKRFGAVIQDTSLAHMLEHLTISTQLRQSTDPYAAFEGTTEWTDLTYGRARIQVGFNDDLVALRAFNEALSFLNNAVITCMS